MAPALGGLLFSAEKLFFLTRRDGWSFTLPYVVLLFVSLGHLLRLIAAIDILGMRGIYHIVFSYAIYTSSFSFTSAVNYSLLFYWNKALLSFGSVSIEWLFKYMVGMIVFVFVAELVSSIFRGFEILLVFNLITMGFYLLIDLIMIIYIFTTVHNLRMYFKVTKESHGPQHSRSRIVRMTQFMIAIALLFIILMIFLILGLVGILNSAAGEAVLFAVYFTVTSGIGILNTLVIRRPGKHKASSQPSASTKSSPTTPRSTGREAVNSQSSVNKSSESLSMMKQENSQEDSSDAKERSNGSSGSKAGSSASQEESSGYKEGSSGSDVVNS